MLASRLDSDYRLIGGLNINKTEILETGGNALMQQSGTAGVCVWGGFTET